MRRGVSLIHVYKWAGVAVWTKFLCKAEEKWDMRITILGGKGPGMPPHTHTLGMEL